MNDRRTAQLIADIADIVEDMNLDPADLTRDLTSMVQDEMETRGKREDINE